MPTVPVLPEKVHVLIARLSYSGYERVEIANWLVQTALCLETHPRVSRLSHNIVTGYPTSRVRNQILVTARRIGANFVCMIDDDMIPDVHSPNRASGYDHLAMHADQQNFFPSALEFALDHNGPCAIAAPYCAGPPGERVLVSRFRADETDDPSSPARGVSLKCFGREEAAERRGIEMVSSLPTGLILIDMRALRFLTPPWFSYEYKTDIQDELASTEDTVFSRNLAYVGVPQYTTWQSWAAHAKMKIVGRPQQYGLQAVPREVRAAVRREIEEERKNSRPADRENAEAQSLLARMDDDGAPVPSEPEEESEPEQPPAVAANLPVWHPPMWEWLPDEEPSPATGSVREEKSQ
jgi:hypothetical protein